MVDMAGIWCKLMVDALITYCRGEASLLTKAFVGEAAAHMLILVFRFLDFCVVLTCGLSVIRSPRLNSALTYDSCSSVSGFSLVLKFYLA